jgi:glycosyltransferase involved in cell wall biosynthesis
MASGVAPIVSAPAGASEVVESGKSGAILSNPTDASELARHLRDYQDVAVRTNAGEAARAAALRYSWDEHMKRLYEIYADVARTRSVDKENALGGVETPNA